ncbi:MAG TPA: class I SAM-dependent methyltransferase [Armatimonadota bacterium]|jgi:SAM-dependent methyltransferase
MEQMSSPALQFDKIAFLYDELMSTVPYNEWFKYLDGLLDKFQHHPKTVLDLCCGTGTFSRLLAEKGYQVSGVDISAGMIEVARQRSLAAGLDIDFRVQDAAQLRFGKKFDLIISLFDSLNYIVDASSLQQTFYRVSEHLNPESIFIFDMNTELALAIGLFNQDNLGHRRAPVHYNWRSSYDKAARICRIHMDFVYRKGGIGEKVEVVHFQRAYDEMEVVEMLITAGLKVHAVYDAYTFEPANRQSDRVFYVARK